MTAPILLSAQPQLRALGASLAASLPLSFRFQPEDEGAQAMLVDGARGWASAALAFAKRGLIPIVVDPTDDDPTLIEDLADQGVTVHLAEGFAGNPAIPVLRERLGDAFTIFVHEAVSPGAVAPSVLAGIRIVRALGIGGLVLSDVQRRDGVALLSATATGAAGPVHFRSMVTTSQAMPAHHRLRAYGSAVLATLRLDAPDTARPAEASVTDADGCFLLPTLFETAHRAALRSLAARPGGDGLRDFAQDIRLVRSLGLG